MNGVKEGPLISFSVITPSFNQAPFIRETIESISSQNYPQLEHVIVDGGSTDGTVDILKKFSEKLRWISEADQGQADALNKGFRMANNQILGWLNSDDVYAPGAVERVAAVFAAYPEIDMVYGNAFYIDRHGKPLRPYPVEKFSLERLAETCFICQPAVFFRRKVFEEVGPLDISLHTCMDYDYWIRIAKHSGHKRIYYLQGPALAMSRMYEENKSATMKETSYRESMALVKHHFGELPALWTCLYLNEIAARDRLARFSGYPLPLRALIRIAFITYAYGPVWGMRSLVISVRECRNLFYLLVTRLFGRSWYS